MRLPEQGASLWRMPPAVRPPSRALRRPERRRSILAGAASAFARHGFVATSMEAIADATGVTKLILYRHFDSKEALYRAVVDRVSARLAEEFAAVAAGGRRSGVAARAFLTVAREDPDGFRLLWRHAAREADFAEYADRFRQLAVEFAESMLVASVRDPVLRRWGAETLVTFLVDAVLAWLDHGDPTRDDEFAERITASMLVMVQPWADPEARPARTPAS